MHPRHRLWSFAALVVAIGVAACGGSGGSSGDGSAGGSAGVSGAAPAGSTAAPSSVGGKLPFTPQIVSSEAIVGPNRFLFGILDGAGAKPLTDPAARIQVAFKGGGPTSTTIPASDARFIWAIPNERGIYAADVTFPTAGDWTVLVNSASGGTIPAGTVPVQFQVKDKGYAIPIGGKAPSTRTPTATNPADIAKIASDQTPDPAFYTTSVDQALANHQPFVLVFATPAFCQSRQCGPTLDGIKAVAKDEPGMTFINVEPYELSYADGRLQPVLDANGQLKPTATTNAWGILSEPWVYVVDRNGIVKGSFEAVVGADELKAAIASVR